ncbi:MAG: hypothetical protein UW75_C0059G0011 [Parcubacteria group bacterium GW2011_GWF2_44_8]|nr:MAG: hypothetical protein UW75_C0059G0011 [Parcubacteria group bacterium GW2011_GWF2_44_8]
MVAKRVIVIVSDQRYQEGVNSMAMRIAEAIRELNPRLLFVFDDGPDSLDLYPLLFADIAVGGDIFREISGGLVDQESAFNNSLDWFIGMTKDYARRELTSPTSIAVIGSAKTLTPLLAHTADESAKDASKKLSDGYLIFNLDIEGNLSLAV